MKAPKQSVVVYDSPKGKAIPFDTAYNDAQVVAALVRCKASHGDRCNARTAAGDPESRPF